MTIEQYQRGAARTIPEGMTKGELTLQAVLGIASEAGEIAGAFEKHNRGHQLSVDDIVKELGDVIWYISMYCTANNIMLEDVLQRNLSKLEARYPEGRYSVERSLNRDVMAE